jgi:hypothetical protein
MYTGPGQEENILYSCYKISLHEEDLQTLHNKLKLTL